MAPLVGGLFLIIFFAFAAARTINERILIGMLFMALCLGVWKWA